MESGVTVHTIAFTGEADNKMDSLAQATGGLAFLYSGAGTSNALNDAFEAIGGINNSKPIPGSCLDIKTAFPPIWKCRIDV